MTNIVWCIAYEPGDRKGSRIPSNHRAIVLHQGGQCRWAGGVKGWLIRAQQPRTNRIACTGQPSLDVLVALHACDTATPLSLYYFRPRVNPFEHANPGGPALARRARRAARVRHGDTPFLVLFQASGSPL